MPVAADIALRYSGGAGNTDPNASLGGAMSTAAGGVVDDDVLHDLFDLVTGTERQAGDTEYRAIYVRNEHASQTAFAARLYVGNPDNTEIDIGLATEAVNTAIAETLANESTAPTGITFSHPTTDGAGLLIGDIPAGQFKGVWIRWTVPAGTTAINPDRGGLNVAFDSE